MSHDPLLARRDFLRAGTALLGGTALGLLPSLTEAAADREKIASVTGQAQSLTLGYWNGGRFVDAETLASGDPSLEAVQLTLSSVGAGELSALEAHAPVPGHGRVPFLLWVAPPSGAERTRSAVVVEPEGIVLSVLLGKAKRELRLDTGRASGAKLREGTYVLAAGRTDLSAFSLEEGRVVSRRAKPSPHIVLVVERA